MPNEPDAKRPDRRRAYAKRAAFAGAALALACPLLPEKWQAVCHALVAILIP